MNLIEEHNNEETPETTIRGPSKCRQFLLNPITIGVFIILCVAIAVPTLVYYFVIDRGTYPEPFPFSCSVDQFFRVPCGPLNATEADCTQTSKCCFDSATQLCYHYLPSQHFYHISTATENNTYEPHLNTTPFGAPTTKQLAFSFSEINESVIKLILHDATTAVDVARFSAAKNYILRQASDAKLNAEIYRNDNSTLLLTTLYGPLVFSEEHLEWTFQLTDEHLFGLGETLIDLADNSTLTKVIYSNANEHNALPIFMAKRGKQFHGVKVRCDGLLEISVLPSKLVILRVVRGKFIELELAVGPSIHDVVQQQKTGFKQISESVEEGLFGVHVCREGNLWDIDAMLATYKNFAEMLRTSDSPFEVSSDCIHANLFLALLLNDGNVIDEVAALPSPLALSLPPQVMSNSAFFQTVTDMAFYKNTTDGATYHGRYFGERVVFPYFEDEASNVIYLENVEKEIENRIGPDPLRYLALYNNWPLDEDFSSSVDLDDLPYFTEAMKEAVLLTLPWHVQAENTTHIEAHNNYASSQVATIRNLYGDRPERPFLFTAGHNLDTQSDAVFVSNTDISWTNFLVTIRRMLFNSISGSGLISIPVCGSSGNYDRKLHEALCIRWYVMASTAPLFQISSVEPYRDPFALYTEHANQLARKALEVRESLRYYIYTVFKENQPLVRPLFYEFPEDVAGYGLDAEYMMGGDILVAHPIVPDAEQLRLYFPGDVAVWYEIWSGNAYEKSRSVNGTISFGIIEGDWVGFVAEGRIIPFKVMDKNQGKTYVKPLVALQKLDNGEETARGVLWIGPNRFELVASNSSMSIAKTEGSQAAGGPSVFLQNSVVLSLTSSRRVACIDELDLMGIGEGAVFVEFRDCPAT